eukprot:g13582.t1
MSCFNGCFGWLQGSPKPVEKNQVESQLTNLKASEEENGNSRQGSKGFKTESGRFQTESGRFHYSVTGMQLPESPQRRSSKGVKYSNTGMPLYDEGDANITPPMRTPVLVSMRNRTETVNFLVKCDCFEEAQQQRQVVGKECQWQMGCELEQWRRLLRQTEFSEPERAEAPGVDVREQEQVDSQCKQPERELEALLSHRHANAGARREEEGVIEENVLKHRHATAVNVIGIDGDD